MIVSQIAALAHAHGIQLPIGVTALGCKLIPTVFAVTRRTHVLGIVLTVGVWARRHFHDLDLLRIKLLDELLLLLGEDRDLTVRSLGGLDLLGRRAAVVGGGRAADGRVCALIDRVCLDADVAGLCPVGDVGHIGF